MPQLNYAIEPRVLDSTRLYPSLAHQLYEAGAGQCNCPVADVLRPGEWPDGTVDDSGTCQHIWHDPEGVWLNTYATAIPLERSRLRHKSASGEWSPIDWKWRGLRVWSKPVGDGHPNILRAGRYGHLYFYEMRNVRGELFPVFILTED